MYDLDTGNIPRNVLLGKKRGYTTVYSVYKVHFTQKLMELINKSFWDRSEPGNTDDLGNRWKKLSKRTIQEKEQLAENGEGTPQNRHDYRWGRLHNAAVAAGRKQSRGALTPTQRAAFDAIYSREYKKAQRIRGNSDAMARKAAEKATWQKFLASKKVRVEDSHIPINIRTGRLVAATAPGTAIYNRYIPPSSDQRISFEDEDSITIDISNVPYAAAVDSVRPIIPDNAEQWVREAHDYALVYAEIEYQRIQAGQLSQQQLDKQKEKRRIDRWLRDEDVPF